MYSYPTLTHQKCCTLRLVKGKNVMEKKHETEIIKGSIQRGFLKREYVFSCPCCAQKNTIINYMIICIMYKKYICNHIYISYIIYDIYVFMHTLGVDLFVCFLSDVLRCRSDQPSAFGTSYIHIYQSAYQSINLINPKHLSFV